MTNPFYDKTFFQKCQSSSTHFITKAKWASWSLIPTTNQVYYSGTLYPPMHVSAGISENKSLPNLVYTLPLFLKQF